MFDEEPWLLRWNDFRQRLQSGREHRRCVFDGKNIPVEAFRYGRTRIRAVIQDLLASFESLQLGLVLSPHACHFSPLWEDKLFNEREISCRIGFRVGTLGDASGYRFGIPQRGNGGVGMVPVDENGRHLR